MPHVICCLGGGSHEVAGPEEALVKMRELFKEEIGEEDDPLPTVSYMLAYYCYSESDDGDCDCEVIRKLSLSLN